MAGRFAFEPGHVQNFLQHPLRILLENIETAVPGFAQENPLFMRDLRLTLGWLENGTIMVFPAVDKWEGNEEAVKAIAKVLADSLAKWSCDDQDHLTAGVFHEMRMYLAEAGQ